MMDALPHLKRMSRDTRRAAESYARERADREDAPMTVWRKVKAGRLCTYDVWYVRARDEQGPDGGVEHATYLPGSKKRETDLTPPGDAR